MQNENESYKGFYLFHDIADSALRNRNRATVLANLADDHAQEDRKISPKGAALILGYFQHVPDDDKNDVKEQFKSNMKERGYVLVGG